jgi:hypothetical protein
MALDYCYLDNSYTSLSKNRTYFSQIVGNVTNISRSYQNFGGVMVKLCKLCANKA